MRIYEAPAKLNLSLLVSPPRADGYHPLESLVQTIEWCDQLEVERGEGHDELDSDIEENLIDRALSRLRAGAEVPPLRMRLLKDIPVAAGLGGGSSDAAAALLAGADAAAMGHARLPDFAHGVGADVSLFLTGGTLMMSGMGEVIERLRPAGGFGVAVVVPDFGLSTKEVYQRWDQLEGPTGDVVSDRLLPPPLRGRMPMRNDLLPAALDVEPRLGDFMADLSSAWATTVCLTGSGSACFAYLPSLEEAADAVSAVSHLAKDGRGAGLRDHGVAMTERYSEED